MERCRGRPGGALPESDLLQAPPKLVPGFVQAVLLMSATEQAHIPEIRGCLETLLGNAAVLTALEHSNPSNNSACS